MGSMNFQDEGVVDVFDSVDGLVWLIKSVREFGMSRHRQVIDRLRDIKTGKIEFLLGTRGECCKT